MKISRRQLIQGTATTGIALATSNLSRNRSYSTAASAAEALAPNSIIEAGEQLRSGSLSVVNLTKHYLAGIKASNPQLNAFITIAEDEALESAASLDLELQQGKDRGPLHGIPIVHKDIYDTAGMLTTVGSEFFKSRVPKQDATTVRQMREAGTVMLGKTNMNEFAAGISGTNAFYGDIHNPWKLNYSPGGSSSGTGAAIAAGLCLGGTGTDTGGSIRVPAAWCGISGIRPTYGLVSLAGIYPRAYSLDVAGPLAKTVKDVALLLDAMAGYDPRDSHSSLSQKRVSYADGLDQGIAGMRIGIIDNYTFRDVDPEVVTAVQTAAETFARLGAEVVPIDIPLLSSGPLEYSALFNILLYEFNQILGDEYNAEPDKSLFGPTVQGNIDKGSEISAQTYETAQKERPSQTAELKAAFKQVDALITPALPMVAPLLSADGEIYGRGRQFTLPFSFTALPSVTTPCGFSLDGLPIGMQIVGNHFEEALILRIAAAFEGGTTFSKERPPIYYDHLMR